MKYYRKLVYPYLLITSIFIIIPTLLIAFYAFTNLGNSVRIISFTLDHFLKFFKDPYFNVLVRSLRIAIITTLISIAIGYPTAFLISLTKEKTQGFLIFLITIPMWINMLIRTYAWISILSDNGILNSFLKLFGINATNLLYTETAVLIGMVYNFLPFMIIPIYTSLTKMDKSLIEASYDLGANKIKTFIKIVLPLSIPGIISGVVMVFLPSVSTFVIPKLLGGGQFMLIGNLIENQFIAVGDWNFGSAVSLIMAIIILISMYFINSADKGEKYDSKSI